MKIAMISLYLPSEDKIGSGYQAHYMANALCAAGHRVTMFSPAGRPEEAHYGHVRVDVGDRLRTFRFAWNLQKMDWSGFDVVHAHGDDYWLWLGGGRGEPGTGPAHVRTMHGSCLAEALHVPGMREKLRMGLLGLSELMATVVADATVCVSKNTTRYYPWIKRVIVNGVDLHAFRPGGKEAEPTLLFVGTYRNRKRGKMLMEVFEREVRPAVPGAKLWMVCGDAPAAEGVEVLGRLSTEELAERYRRAWVFCLPSTYEGFGVPYIEAMASGTAVVATGNVGAREVLGEGRYGMIARDEELGKALVRLLTDGEERGRWAEAGLERSREFGWERVVEAYERVYGDIMNGNAARVAVGRSA